MSFWNNRLLILLVCFCPILLGGDCGDSPTGGDDDSCFTNPSPADSTVVSGTSVELTWRSSVEPDFYRVDWGYLGDGEGTSENLTERKYTLGDLQPYQMYWWHVESWGEGDIMAGCIGSNWIFTTSSSECYEFRPESPRVGETIESKQTALIATINEIPKDHQHRLKIGLDRNNLQWASEATDTSSFLVSDLIEDTVYYWQVWSVLGDEAVCGSIIWNFRTPIFNCLGRTNPLNNDTVHGRSVLLEWEPLISGPEWRWGIEITLQNGSTHYHYGSADSPEQLITNLIMDTTYVWQVSIRDQQNDIQCFSEEIVFHTRLPDPPNTPSPVHLAPNVSEIATLSWAFEQPPDDPYLFNVYIHGTVAPLVMGENLTAPTFDPGVLDLGESYSWYVIAHNESSDTLWSDSWRFYTADDPNDLIYANLIIETEWHDEYQSYDNIRARFDSTYAPTEPVTPLEADSVKCMNWKLYWNSYSGIYDYGYVPNLFDHDSTYFFTAFGNAAVPNLVAEITFPGCTPEITSPAYPDTVEFSGFDVSWSGTCEGQVVITIMNGDDSTGVWVETENDGNHHISEADLASLNDIQGTYFLVIMVLNHQTIDEEGYDPRSTITARTYNKIFLPMK